MDTVEGEISIIWNFFLPSSFDHSLSYFSLPTCGLGHYSEEVPDQLLDNNNNNKPKIITIIRSRAGSESSNSTPNEANLFYDEGTEEDFANMRLTVREEKRRKEEEEERRRKDEEERKRRRDRELEVCC